MQKHIDLGHVERVPKGIKSAPSVPSWFIPVVLVHQPKKEAIRITIDGAAKYQNVSLNDLLFSGPDLNNALRSVLHRLRLYLVTFTLDLRHMFNCFVVPPEHRSMLQFHWWNGNDPSREVVAYRYTVHPFGACSSPAVAMFAMRCIAEFGRNSGELTENQARFIETSFYMDDGTDSLPEAQEAIQLLVGVKAYLQKFGIEVHKINSNEPQVKESFASNDYSDSIVCIDPNPVPKTLGVVWDTVTDEVSVRMNIPDRPFTRRGVLATVNTVFDPLGLACPVVLGGRQFQRQLLTAHPVKQSSDWDEPLSVQFAEEWHRWKTEAMSEASLTIPRCLCPFQKPKYVEIHAFADASEIAISCVLYLKAIDEHNSISVRFVAACSKLAPNQASNAIHRLELCAAVLVVEMTNSIIKDLSIDISATCMYSDSMIVLGYIRNTTKRFSVYVTRRVEAITRLFPSSHWRFVSTHDNPADLGTRPRSPTELKASIWFTGPAFLLTQYSEPPCRAVRDLPETMPLVPAMRTASQVGCEFMALARRHSSWMRVVWVVCMMLLGMRRALDRARQARGVSLAIRGELSARSDAELVMFRAAQAASFADVLQLGGEVVVLGDIPEKHPLSGVAPFIEGGLIRVGGRLSHLESPFNIIHPIVLDSKNEITQLFATYCHQISPHQGRLITMHQIRSRGVFILGGRRLVDNIIRSCVICKRLRGSPTSQVMADLPPTRLSDTAPFDHVGVDVAGPFYVHDGKSTRRTSSSKKVFVLVLNCLSSRAVHLEVLAGMDTASFLNALRRFFAIRGVCRSILSDHGTNFVGALGECADLQQVQRGVEGLGVQWRMNPVGASHFGGAYERKIGSIRRALEAMLLTCKTALNRDEFCTLLQEAAAVVNSTPLFHGSDSPGEPLAVAPAHLLNLKTPGESPSPEKFSESDLQAYGKRRWRKVQFLADCFWAQWRKDYLQAITRRVKWTRAKPNLKTNDVVILRDKNAPRCSWPLAVVRRALPGRDSKVRRVIVAVADAGGNVREVERAVTDLILLFSAE